METKTYPQLGDNIIADIQNQLSNTNWKVDWAELPKGWSVQLKSRLGKLYQSGDKGSFWIFEILTEKKLYFLSDSEFGRLPISDRMRPRYIQAIQSVLQVIDHQKNYESINPDNLSEAKGMFNRCVRKDQWDWLTVYDILGRPPISILRMAADCLGNLSRALKHNESDSIRENIEIFYSFDLKKMLHEGLTRITETTPRLNNALSFTPFSDKSMESSTKEIDNDSNPYIISQVAKAKLELANAEHKHSLQILVNFLKSNGFVVERNHLVDAYSMLKTGPAIFEVKSITLDNEHSQCRHALSQLYEYRYLHSIHDASLWVVLSNPPKKKWIVDYLQGNMKINVLWINDNKLEGPGKSHLFESDSASRKRKS